MCRLAAYSGPAIPLERIIVAPCHSLLEQSQGATEAKLAVNGDGFGIAWYGNNEQPGLYRDVLPAWSDGNLPSLCRMIESKLFLAHVRASTAGETSRVNCHPFTYKNWSFMHNGQIAGFEKIRRKLETTLPDNLYDLRRGTTDSELIFLLLLANGLETAPKAACETVIDLVKSHQASISKPNRLAFVFSDGDRLFALRHSCDEDSPSLYASNSLDSGGRAIASEPLDNLESNWSCIPEDHFACLWKGVLTLEPLATGSSARMPNMKMAAAPLQGAA